MKGLPGDTSIRDFLKAVASSDEPHDSVSVAAVSGAFGTSLLLMVAALPQTRSDSVEDRMRLLDAAVAVSQVQEQLLETVETDTAVKIFAARNMPQVNELQRAERQAALQLALRAAADVPLEVLRLCAHGLTQARDVAAHSSRAAAADVQLGIRLLQSALTGARMNLEGKIGSLTDAGHVSAVVEEIANLSEEASRAVRAAEAFLKVPPA
jgi:methenyltetrahydrofolate cyclohydrolase